MPISFIRFPSSFAVAFVFLLTAAGRGMYRLLIINHETYFSFLVFNI
jgi:hypothetical protein